MTMGDRLAWLEGLGPVEPVVRFARDWVARFLAVQGIDRAMSLAAYGYSALIPLLIVYASLSPSGETFADAIIDRFDLDRTSAQAVQQAFAPTGGVGGSVTALGIVLLVISALSFTRSVQRLYEGVFGMRTLGFRNTQWALLWLAALWAFVIIRPILLGALPGVLETIGSLAISALLWLMTPYLLLGRRLRWTRLAPAAVLSTIGMTGVGIWSVIWMPHVLGTSAAQFGIIGIGFALLTWLVAAAVVLVIAASGGALISDRIIEHRAAP